MFDIIVKVIAHQKTDCVFHLEEKRGVCKMRHRQLFLRMNSITG